jgi:hypothetical protein
LADGWGGCRLAAESMDTDFEDLPVDRQEEMVMFVRVVRLGELKVEREL